MFSILTPLGCLSFESFVNVNIGRFGVIKPINIPTMRFRAFLVDHLPVSRYLPFRLHVEVIRYVSNVHTFVLKPGLSLSCCV